MTGVIFLILRILLAIALYVFLLVILVTMWKDLNYQKTMVEHKNLVPSIYIQLRNGMDLTSYKFNGPVVAIGTHPNSDIVVYPLVHPCSGSGRRADRCQEKSPRLDREVRKSLQGVAGPVLLQAHRSGKLLRPGGQPCGIPAGRPERDVDRSAQKAGQHDHPDPADQTHPRHGGLVLCIRGKQPSRSPDHHFY